MITGKMIREKASELAAEYLWDSSMEQTTAQIVGEKMGEWMRKQSMRWVSVDDNHPSSWANVIYRRKSQPRVIFGPIEFHGVTNDRKTLFFEGRNDDIEISSCDVEWLYEPPTTE